MAKPPIHTSPVAKQPMIRRDPDIFAEPQNNLYSSPPAAPSRQKFLSAANKFKACPLGNQNRPPLLCLVPILSAGPGAVTSKTSRRFFFSWPDRSLCLRLTRSDVLFFFFPRDKPRTLCHVLRNPKGVGGDIYCALLNENRG